MWAANAAESDPMAAFHTRVWMSQLADWKQKTQQIQEIEHELAGEMGPIENYATAKSICARIANRMTQGVFKMVSGRRIYQHASRLDRGYVMDKLLKFLRDHETSPAVIVWRSETCGRSASQIESTGGRCKAPGGSAQGQTKSPERTSGTGDFAGGRAGQT